MSPTEIIELREADKRAKGNVDHEFSQDVIDKCEPYIQSTIERVIKGETTFEAEEKKLLALWNELHKKITD